MRKKTAKTNECVDGVSETRDGRRGRGGGLHILCYAPPRSLKEAEAVMAVTMKERGVEARTESQGNCHEAGKRKASGRCPACKTTSTSRYRYYNTDQGTCLMNGMDHASVPFAGKSIF
jgi:hypothetical protein